MATTTAYLGVAAALIYLTATVGAQSYRECKYEELRRCEKAISDFMSRPKSEFTRSDAYHQCRSFREDFGCVLWESITCTDQRESSVLSRARQFLVDSCDRTDRAWRDKSCFQKQEIRRCENQYQSERRSSYSQDSCRAYTSFRDCVENQVREQCGYSDRPLVPIYVYDTDPEGWRCSSSSSRGGYPSYPDTGSSGVYGDICCGREQCSSSRLDQCRDSVQRAVDMQRDSQFRDQSRQCRDLRNSFNCLLWQNANCGGMGRGGSDGTLINRAKNLIASMCDMDGGWKSRQCYQQSDMKNCERRLIDRGSSYMSADNCRNFLDFKECVKNVMRTSSRCSTEDELYLGSYYIDQGRDKAWMCSGSSSSGGYGTSSQGGRYPDLGLGGSFGAGGSYSGNYGNADETMCSSMVMNDANWCFDVFTRQRRESDEETRKICCATFEYEDCIKRSVDNKCGTRGSEAVQNRLNERVKGDILQYCLGITKEQCSGAPRPTTLGWSVLGATLVALLAFVLS